MRPNLMSSKRPTSGEDSILAMLERDPLRRRGKGPSIVRLLCYGAGGVLVLALTGTLVWLADGNQGFQPQRDSHVLADAARPAAPRVVAPPAPPASAALVVDQPPAAAPPLRMLKPAAASPARPAPVVVAAPPAARPATPARPRQPALARAGNRAAPARARPAEAPVDADVALISAVIVHANGHAPENSQMTELLCPNDACQAKATRQ